MTCFRIPKSVKKQSNIFQNLEGSFLPVTTLIFPSTYSFSVFSCIFDIVKIQSFLHRSTLNIFAEVDDLFDNVDQYFSNFLESFVFVSVFVFVFFHVLL